MASKRKSSIPCMVPAKSKTLREEVVVGCLPELLPTIPEDSILSISGENGEETQRTPKHAGSSTLRERVVHRCSPCSFETTDLNLFLNHMDTCHMDFHTQPLFYCLSCKVSLANFEGLALHNAKAHPQLHAEANPAKWSLQVTKHDGVIRVEQALLREKDYSSESGPSITKMPVMKMMVKGEQKDIVVPHMIETWRTDFTNDRLMVVGNGTAGRHELPGTAHITGTVSLPVLKTSNSYSLPPQNARPLWNVTQSPDSNCDLPKVMIPLSSIPTYDPAMDLNSFLKASFGKFPYPTKAELCYLTVVSGFPEEQIKLWFAAQRLKQGISWSPEEIEDTRRKMFSTVFQATPKTWQKKSSQHLLSQHCVPIQPLAVRSGYVPYIPKSHTVGWKGGAVVRNALGSFQLIKETENGAFSQKAGNNLMNRGIPKHTENGRQSGEGSALTLTPVVSSVDCNVNKTTNGTSKPSPTPASECRDMTHISTSNKSNNGSVYKSTSLSISCTNDDGVFDHTSKATSTRTGEVLPVLTDSLGAQTNLLDSGLLMSKLPEDLQGVTHSPIQEQAKLGAGRDINVCDSQSAMEQVGNISSAVAPLQEDDHQPPTMATPTQLERLSPKSLGVPQVLFSDSPFATAIHYKDHDAPCFKQSPSAI